MLVSVKSFFFSHLITISISICASKNIEYLDTSSDSDLRIFFFNKELPFIRYSKLSSFNDTKVLWTNRTNMITLEYLPEAKTFFWTTDNGELYSVVWNENEDAFLEEFIKTNADFLPKKDNAKLLYSEEKWFPRSIALDDIGKKLYIVDAVEKSVDVIALGGKSKARLFKNECVIPMEVVVDPNEGLLFLYAYNSNENKTQIRRMNMDGSDQRLIIDDNEYTNNYWSKVHSIFSIDRINKRLYYGTELDNLVIASVDYNGGSNVRILNNIDIAHTEVHNNHLYWANSFTKNKRLMEAFPDLVYDMIYSMNDEYYTIKSCDISDQSIGKSLFVCESDEKNGSPLNKINKLVLKKTFFEYNYSAFPDSFKIIDLSPRENLANPCLENNGTCEDYCLLKPSDMDNKLSFGCVCCVGRKINENGKTCSNIEERKVAREEIPHGCKKFSLPYEGSFDHVIRDEAYKMYGLPNSFLNKILYEVPEVLTGDTLSKKYEINAKEDFVKPHNENKV